MEERNSIGKLLNLKCIQAKLEDCIKYAETAKGRDLVLVVGNTGVGKSTTCNYLFGFQMKEKEINGIDVIETVEMTDFKIGHDVTSATRYAKTMLINDVSPLSSEESNSCICLLDCPGFLGNASVLETLVGSISTELAIRNAKEIKGILIVVSFLDLLDNRLLRFRQLAKTLVSLFKNPLEMVQYSIFVVTKNFMSVDKAKKRTIAALNAFVKYCEKQSEKFHGNEYLISAEGLTYADYDKIATYFSAILEKPNDITIIDPLDEGQCRQSIFAKINGIKPRTDTQDQRIRPITIEDFDFSVYDENRVKFTRAMYNSTNQVDGSIDESMIFEILAANV